MFCFRFQVSSFNELSYELLIGSSADEELMIVLCNDVSIESLNDDTPLLGSMDDAIVGVV